MLACGDTSSGLSPHVPGCGSVQLVCFVVLGHCGGELCVAELRCHMTDLSGRSDTIGCLSSIVTHLLRERRRDGVSTTPPNPPLLS